MRFLPSSIPFRFLNQVRRLRAIIGFCILFAIEISTALAIEHIHPAKITTSLPLHLAAEKRR